MNKAANGWSGRTRGRSGSKLLKVGWQEEMTLVRRGAQTQHNTEGWTMLGSRLRAKRLGGRGGRWAG